MRFRFVRLVTDSLPSIIVAASAGFLTLSVWQVGKVVRLSKRVHVLQEVIVAATAAEEAAFHAAKQDLSEDSVVQVRSSTGMLCSVFLSTSEGLPASPGSSESPEIQIEVRGRNQRYYSYTCEMLPGAAPIALGYPLSIRKSVLDARPQLRPWLTRQSKHAPGVMNDDTDLPQLHIRAAQSLSPHAAGWLGLRREDSLALLRTPSGTDLPDHVFAAKEDGVCRPTVPKSGTLLVAGHLWVDRGTEPLVIELSEALTVVVRGNIYIGRSLEVRGTGKLTLVAQRGNSELFADRDADGRWSKADELLTGDHYRGPVEGTGAIYLGLPAQANTTDTLTIAACLYAQGEVHLLADHCEVQGALVLGQGLTWLGQAALTLSGTSLPNTQRERVPGFRRQGGRRPSLLQPAR